MQEGEDRKYSKKNRGVKVTDKLRSKELKLQAIKNAHKKLKRTKKKKLILKLRKSRG